MRSQQYSGFVSTACPRSDHTDIILAHAAEIIRQLIMGECVRAALPSSCCEAMGNTCGQRQTRYAQRYSPPQKASFNNSLDENVTYAPKLNYISVCLMQQCSEMRKQTPSARCHPPVDPLPAFRRIQSWRYRAPTHCLTAPLVASPEKGSKIISLRFAGIGSPLLTTSI